MKVAAIGFCCTDVYENLNRHYSTGNGIDCIVNIRKRGIKTSAVTTVGKVSSDKRCWIYVQNMV